jgi:hypothetical protein
MPFWMTGSLNGSKFGIVVTCSVFVTRNWFHKLHNWSVYSAQKPAVVYRCPALLSNGTGLVVHVSPFHGTLHEMKAIKFLSHFSSVMCIRTGSGIFKEEYRIRKILTLCRKSHKKHSLSVTYWLQVPWRWYDSVETCRSVIIYEVIVRLLVLKKKKKTHKEHLFRKLHIGISVVIKLNSHEQRQNIGCSEPILSSGVLVYPSFLWST